VCAQKTSKIFVVVLLPDNPGLASMCMVLIFLYLFYGVSSGGYLWTR